MLTLIIGTNRPGSNTSKVARLVEEVYSVAQSRRFTFSTSHKLPAEIFSPSSYAEKPKSFHPFAEAVLKARA